MVIIIQKLLTFVLLLILFTFFGSCQEEIKKNDIVAPKQIIPIAEAQNMYTNYTERRLPLIKKYEDSINRNSGIEKEFDVARFVSYDYQTIKQYLAFIENEAEKANVDISTLRFYFSNYPDKPFFENKDSVLHPRQNSIILSPTIKKENRDYLFYIGGSESQPQPILLLDNFEEIRGLGLSKTHLKSHASLVPNFVKPNPIFSSKSLTMNRGGSAPPPQHQ